MTYPSRSDGGHFEEVLRAGDRGGRWPDGSDAFLHYCPPGLVGVGGELELECRGDQESSRGPRSYAHATSRVHAEWNDDCVRWAVMPSYVTGDLSGSGSGDGRPAHLLYSPVNSIDGFLGIDLIK